MDIKLRQQLEGILQESDAEERAAELIRQALEVEILLEDAWLRDLFKLAATLQEGSLPRGRSQPGPTLAPRVNLGQPFILQRLTYLGLPFILAH